MRKLMTAAVAFAAVMSAAAADNMYWAATPVTSGKPNEWTNATWKVNNEGSLVKWKNNADTAYFTYGDIVKILTALPQYIVADIPTDETFEINYSRSYTWGLRFSYLKRVVKTGPGTLSIDGHSAVSKDGNGLEKNKSAVFDLQQGTLYLRLQNKSDCTLKSPDYSPLGGTLFRTAKGTIFDANQANQFAYSTNGLMPRLELNGQLTTAEGAMHFNELALGDDAKIVVWYDGDATYRKLAVHNKLIVTGEVARTFNMSTSPTTVKNYGLCLSPGAKRTEVYVDDITGDEGLDFQVSGGVSSTFHSTNGFIKTGSGKMWIRGANEAISGLVTVSNGAFSIGCNISAVEVVSGASVGGAGTLGSLTLEDGAGFFANSGQTDILKVSSLFTFPAHGKIYVNNAGNGYFSKANIVKSNVGFAGVENLANWQVCTAAGEMTGVELKVEDGVLTVNSRMYWQGGAGTASAPAPWSRDVTHGAITNWLANNQGSKIIWKKDTDIACFSGGDYVKLLSANPYFVEADIPSGESLVFKLSSSLSWGSVWNNLLNFTKEGAGKVSFEQDGNPPVGGTGLESKSAAEFDIREGTFEFHLNVPNAKANLSPLGGSSIRVAAGATLEPVNSASFALSTNGLMPRIELNGTLAAGTSCTSMNINELALGDGYAINVSASAAIAASKSITVHNKLTVTGEVARTLTFTPTTSTLQNLGLSLNPGPERTEIYVEDITGNGDCDFTVPGGQTGMLASTNGFVKTGSGTMKLASDINLAQGSVTVSNGVLHSAGTLPAVTVASGAYIGGTGTAASLALEAGAGLYSEAGQTSAGLTVTAGVTIPATGKIFVNTLAKSNPNRAKLIKCAAGFTGLANLDNWSVSTSSGEQANLCVKVINNTLTVVDPHGLIIMFE